MIQKRLTHGTIAIGVSTAALLLLVAPAAAAKESTRAICTAALATYKTGAAHERAGRLQAARDAFQSCAEVTVCGGLYPKCQAKVDQLTSQMSSPASSTSSQVSSRAPSSKPARKLSPEACTVVPIVSDETGTPRADVQVMVDGELLTSKIDGKALQVAAGMHEFTFATDRGVFATQKVLIAEGERNRKIEVAMGGAGGAAAKAARGTPVSAAGGESQPASEKSPSEASSPAATAAEANPHEPSGREDWALPHSALPYVIAGAGLAGVGAGTLLTVWGNKDNDMAVAQCHGSCPQSTVDHIRSTYLAADVSFGVGLAALGVATWMFATSRSVEEKPQPTSALILDVQPTRSGALGTLKGAF